MDEAEATPPPATGPLRRSIQTRLDDVSRPRRTVTARINTNVVDRYRTVVLPSGGDLRQFVQTPAVLWQHGMDPTRGSQPVGHCSSIKFRKAEDDILAVTQFKTDEYSDRIFQNYVDGTLTSFSVDFLPDAGACGRPTPEELRARPDWAGAECVYRKWELTGYSAVAYPGNPEALAIAVERGLWTPDDARAELPAKRDMAEGGGSTGGYATETKDGRCVALRDGMWCVMCDDQVVGRYETQAEAEHALANPEPVESPAERTAPPLPEGIRTYTPDEIAAVVFRTVFDPMYAVFAAQLRDIDDLARGRV